MSSGSDVTAMEQDLCNMLGQLQKAQLAEYELEEKLKKTEASAAEARQAETQAYLMLSQVQEQTRARISELADRAAAAEVAADKRVAEAEAQLAEVRSDCSVRVAAAQGEAGTAKKLLRESTLDVERSSQAEFDRQVAELVSKLEEARSENDALAQKLVEADRAMAAAREQNAADVARIKEETDGSREAAAASVAAAKRAADERIEIAMASALSSDQARLDLEAEHAASTQQAVNQAFAEAREKSGKDHAAARLELERLKLEIDQLRQSATDEVAEAQMVQADAAHRAAEKFAAADAAWKESASKLTAEITELRQREQTLRQQLETAEARAAALGQQVLELDAHGATLGSDNDSKSKLAQNASGLHEPIGSPRARSIWQETAAMAKGPDSAAVDPDEVAMFRMSEATNAAVLAAMKVDMQKYQRTGGGNASLEGWARSSEWAHDTGVDIGRAMEGQWKELFEEVKMEEAMRQALQDNESGRTMGPSPVVQLSVGKKLAEEEVQHLTRENRELEETCIALRKKLISLESIMTHTERMEAKAEQEARERETILQEESVNRTAVGELLVKHLDAGTPPLAKEQALEVLSGVLELDAEQKVRIGLISRWELAQPDLVKQVSEGSNQQTFVDLWATFLSAS